MPSKKVIKVVLVVVVLVLIVLAKIYNLDDYLTLENLKNYRIDLASSIENNPTKSISIYFAIYVLVTALSLPGAAILTLAGGGLIWILERSYYSFFCKYYWCNISIYIIKISF